jgi:hypothetical protein
MIKFSDTRKATYFNEEGFSKHLAVKLSQLIGDHIRARVKSNRVHLVNTTIRKIRRIDLPRLRIKHGLPQCPVVHVRP